MIGRIRIPALGSATAPAATCGPGSHAGFSTACEMRRTTSSSVGYGDFSAGRSGSGISSIR